MRNSCSCYSKDHLYTASVAFVSAILGPLKPPIMSICLGGNIGDSTAGDDDQDGSPSFEPIRVQKEKALNRCLPHDGRF